MFSGQIKFLVTILDGNQHILLFFPKKKHLCTPHVPTTCKVQISTYTGRGIFMYLEYSFMVTTRFALSGHTIPYFDM